MFNKRICVVAFVVLVFAGSVPDVEATKLRDFLKGGQKRLGDRWKKTKGHCSGCGKPTITGAKCVKCRGKSVQKGLKKFTSGAKKAVTEGKKRLDEMVHSCLKCGKLTRFPGSKCASCRGKSVRDGAKRIGNKAKGIASSARKKLDSRKHPCSGCGKIIYVGPKCVRCLSKAAVSRGSQIMRASGKKINALRDSAMVAYGSVLSEIRNPENRRKVAVAAGAVMDVRRKINAAKRRGASKAFGALAGLKLPGGTTLGEYASSRLRKKYPELASTGLLDDPAETATALVCHDADFFLSDVKLLSKNGRNVSVFGAIRESSSYDAGGIIKYLKIAKATSDVSYAADTGEGYADAVVSVFKAVESAK